MLWFESYISNIRITETFYIHTYGRLSIFMIDEF